MAYTKTVWEDLPSEDTPFVSTALNNIENGIETLDTSKVNTSDIVDNLSSTSATVPLSAKQGKVLNDKIIDSGWTNVSLENGWSNLGNRTTQYRKIGNIVYVRGTITGGTQTSQTTLFTFDIGYRVSQDYTKIVISCYNGSSVVTGYLTLKSSGEVKADIDLPTNNEVALYFSFVAN